MTSSDEKKKKAVVYCSITGCVVVFILAITLIATSLKKLEETEYGLRYNVFSKVLDDEAESGGLFSGAPGFRFVRFPSTYVTVDLEDRKCVSRDGLVVGVSVTFQYQALPEYLYDVATTYRDATEWGGLVEVAGLSAIHHACSDFAVSNFQNQRARIQAAMEDNLRTKLEPNPETNSTGVYARAVSLQLRNVRLPGEYSEAVRDKQSAEEDIELAINQRQQETTKAETDLLKAKEEARKILDTAQNDANLTLTEATLSAAATTFALAQEAEILKEAKDSLGLSGNGVLAHLVANGLLAEAESLTVTTGEPARLARPDALSTTTSGGGGGDGAA